MELWTENHLSKNIAIELYWKFYSLGFEYFYDAKKICFIPPIFMIPKLAVNILKPFTILQMQFNSQFVKKISCKSKTHFAIILCVVTWLLTGQFESNDSEILGGHSLYKNE